MEIIKESNWTSIDYTNYERIEYNIEKFPLKSQMASLAADEIKGTVLAGTFIDHLMSVPFSFASYKTVNIVVPLLKKVFQYKPNTGGYEECNMCIMYPENPKKSAYAM
jgi:hypothetical protein